MLKVYIADDEEAVRQGLKNIIDWDSLNFEICGEAGNGLSAYHDIKAMHPDLILIDIRMPKMQGLDLANRLREEGYEGHIIVLSGYSEFKYAQEAIRCDVDYYLTKPIEEAELYKAVLDIKNLIQKRQLHTEHLSYYQEKAKDKILEDIFMVEGKSLASLDYSLGELNLTANQYQVLILHSIEEEFDAYGDLCNNLKVPYKTTMIEQLRFDIYQVILLKGELIINRFESFRKDYHRVMDFPYFIAVGGSVSGLNDIYYSYHEALAVHERRFFFDQHKFIAEEVDLPDIEALTDNFTANNSKEMGKQLYDLITIYKKKECDSFIEVLNERLTHSKNSTESIKSFLAGMYIYIVQEFKRDYASYNVDFKANAEIIQWFHARPYLQELMSFMKEETDRLIKVIGGFGSDSIVDEIVEFINHHYVEDIKLKNLAPKFGYNSSYLGKIFNKRMEMSFNDYLHIVRTKKAKILLLNDHYKVYEISSLVGYKNVDYFHLKFKQFEGCTPNDYRIKHHINV